MAINYPLSLPATPGPRHVYWSPRAAVAGLRSPFTLSEQVQAHQGQLWQARFELPPMPELRAAAWVATLLKLNGRQGTFLFGDSIRKIPYGSALGFTGTDPYGLGIYGSGVYGDAVVASTPLVNGGNQTGQELLTDGWTPSTNGLLIGGVDWLQLGGPGYQAVWSGVPTWLTDLNISARDETTITIAFSDTCPVGGGTLNWKMGSVSGLQAVNSGADQVTITHNLGLGSARLHKVLNDVNADVAGNAVIDIWPRLRESPIDNAPLILSACKGTFRLADNVMDWDISVVKHYGLEIDVTEAF